MVEKDSRKQEREPRRHRFDENFSRYYHDISKTKILDADTERKLFIRYRKKRGKKVYWTNSHARELIIHSCLRFVVTLAHRYSKHTEMLKDLVSAGNEGLLFALDRYDPHHGSQTRFLSFATYYILLYIRTELQNAELVVMPSWRQKTIRKVRQARNYVATTEGCEPDVDTLCEAVEITPAQLERLKIEKFQYSPIEFTRVSTNGNESKAITRQAKELLATLLLGLGTKERFVLRAYFGLASDPMSLRQIANVLGVSSERVRQIKVNALAKLRKGLVRNLDIKTLNALCSD